MVPCGPEEACVGNNECLKGYTGERCALCCDYSHQFLDNKRTIPNPDCWKGDDFNVKDIDDAIRYYRMNGECIPCPENPW